MIEEMIKGKTRVIMCLLLIFIEIILYIIARGTTFNISDAISQNIWGYTIQTGDAYIDFNFNEGIKKIRIIFYGMNAPSTDIVLSFEEKEGKTRTSDFLTSEAYGEDSEFLVNEEISFNRLRVYLKNQPGTKFRNVRVVNYNRYIETLLLLMMLLLAFAFAFILIKDGRIIDLIEGLKERTKFLIFITVFAAVIIILLSRYFFGGYYFLFNDVANDSYVQTYPSQIDLARRFKAGIINTDWDPFIGLGMQMGSFWPTLNNWYLLLGEHLIPFMRGVNFALVVYIAGIFCYMYISCFTKSFVIRTVIALGYAFSGPIILRAPWHSYPTLMSMLIVWLYLYELFFQRKRWVFLIIGTVVFFTQTSLYDNILFGFLYVGYIVIRYFCTFERGVKLIEIVKTLFVYGLIATISSMDNMLTSLIATISSDRFQLAKFSEIGLLTDIRELISLWSRTLGLSITGLTQFSGVSNVLEDGTFYCGIIVVLLLPIALIMMCEKEKIVFCFMYLAAIIYIVIIPIRFFLNGKSSDKWRMSSVWIIVLMITAATFALRRLFNGFDVKQKKIIKTVLTVTLILDLLFLCYLIYKNYYSSLNMIGISAGFLIIYYLIIMTRIDNAVRISKIQLLLLFTVIGEIVIVAYFPLNDRYVMTEDTLATGYNDATVKVIDWINEREAVIGYGSQSFRIDKKYNSVQIMDSLAQGYKDSKSYVGQVGIGQSVLDVYRTYNLPMERNKYLYGSGANYKINSLLATKYILSKQTGICDYGYKLIDNIDGINIFENENAIPMAFTYDESIDTDDFYELDTNMKSWAILQACVANENLSNISKVDVNELAFFDEGYCSDARIDQIEKDVFSIDSKDSPIKIVISYENDNESNAFGALYLTDSNDNQYETYISYNPGKSFDSYDININNVREISIYTRGNVTIKDVNVFHIKEGYFQKYEETTRKLRNKGLKNMICTYNSIEGEVDCKGNEVLFVSVPFNDKWEITVDGINQNTIKLNGGFLGTLLSKGHHKVKVHFGMNGWKNDNMFKCISILIMVISIAIYNLKYSFRERKLK